MKSNSPSVMEGFSQRKAFNGIGKVAIFFSMLFFFSSCELFRDFIKDPGTPKNNFPMVRVPGGYQIEKVVGGLTYPTSVVWDDQGNMFVSEAGGGFEPLAYSPIRILQVKGSKVIEAIDLTGKGVVVPFIGMEWHNGAFYITHRAEDLTGAVSRVTKEGVIETLITGIVDSQSEHQTNDIRMGPDGRMYIAVGLAGNSAVVGPDIGPFVKLSPNVHPRPCQDIVLTGRNYRTPNIMTEDPDDMTLTGAYVPFGTETQPGEVIKGVTLCGGSILSFDPNDPMGTVEVHSWGYRNLIGLAWNENTGQMYAAENGYDIRGSRPVKDEIDATLKIEKGKWYGVPDFSAGREPLTDPKFQAPEEFGAERFIGDESLGKNLGFVIDHAASGLTPPDPSVVVGRHEFNSSPSLLDVGPENWGDWEGDLFIAEWGDLAPPTNPLRGANNPAGYKIARVNPDSGELEAFVSNRQPGPASYQGKTGEGIERPFDVKFGPDGNMYIVDYGVVEINMDKAPPYVYKANTGAIWKVSKKKKDDNENNG